MGERTPRPICDTELELVALFDLRDPPAALAQSEVGWIVGWRGASAGDPDKLPWAGCRSYLREQFLEIEVAGRVLRYEYEGALAYALVSATKRDDAAGPGAASHG